MAGGGDELKLLNTWFSPFGSRVKLALHLKGLSYEYIEEDLMNKSEVLLQSNPVHKKVPVLFHKGKPICESMVIVEYIDEAFSGVGPSLLPSDPYERATARFWVAFIEHKVRLLLQLSCNRVLFQWHTQIKLSVSLPVLVCAQFVAPWFQIFEGDKTRAEKAEAVKQILAAVATMEEALGECSNGKPFFGGDRVGIVDVALGGLLVWVLASEVLFGVKFMDASRAPLLAAWAERFTALDVAKVALPDFGRVLKHAMMRRGAAAAGFAALNN